jgi:hypothetical protein
MVATPRCYLSIALTVTAGSCWWDSTTLPPGSLPPNRHRARIDSVNPPFNTGRSDALPGADTHIPLNSLCDVHHVFAAIYGAQLSGFYNGAVNHGAIRNALPETHLSFGKSI